MAGAVRARVHRLPGGRILWRVLIGVVGGAVVIVGAVLLPLPGPGWLIIFLGLGILATEFQWARRLLTTCRRFVARWTVWVARQPRWGQVLIGGLGLALLAVLAGAGWLVYDSREIGPCTLAEPSERRAISSAGEHCLHTAGVTGSIPVSPTPV